MRRPTADPYTLLDKYERRRRWKTVLLVGGVMVVVLGLTLLPLPVHVFTKRDLSAFSAVVDTRAFVWEGLACVALGLAIVGASFLIHVDIDP